MLHVKISAQGNALSLKVIQNVVVDAAKSAKKVQATKKHWQNVDNTGVTLSATMKTLVHQGAGQTQQDLIVKVTRTFLVVILHQ